MYVLYVYMYIFGCYQNWFGIYIIFFIDILQIGLASNVVGACFKNLPATVAASRQMKKVCFLPQSVSCLFDKGEKFPGHAAVLSSSLSNHLLLGRVCVYEHPCVHMYVCVCLSWLRACFYELNKCTRMFLCHRLRECE